MSHRGNRHQRRPSQGVFVVPDNLSAPLPDDITAPPPFAAQVPNPPPDKSGGGGVSLPPPKPAEEIPISDRPSKG